MTWTDANTILVTCCGFGRLVTKMFCGTVAWMSITSPGEMYPATACSSPAGDDGAQDQDQQERHYRHRDPEPEEGAAAGWPGRCSPADRGGAGGHAQWASFERSVWTSTNTTLSEPSIASAQPRRDAAAVP